MSDEQFESFAKHLKGKETIRITVPRKPADEEQKAIPLMPDIETNILASKRFIEAIRNPKLYKQDPDRVGFVKSELGYSIEGRNVEDGWFSVGSITETAQERYQLPLAIYIDQNHARLLVKGPYHTSEGRKIKVYDPKESDFSEIKVNDDGEVKGLYVNNLAFKKRARNQNDLTALLENTEFGRFKNLLTYTKAFSFQKDNCNCIPYCLFVNAMLYGLESGNTPFKTQGIKQFEQDFGVRILTREEILPKPNIRILD
jgi:hypothetical protein